MNQVFQGLLRRLDSRSGISFDEVQSWPPGTVPILEQIGLLKRANNATTLLCTECERCCQIEPVRVQPPQQEEVLCWPCLHDTSMGVLTAPLDSLQTWRLDTLNFGKTLHHLLGLTGLFQNRPPHDLLLGERRVDGVRYTFYLIGSRNPSQDRLTMLDGPGVVALLPTEMHIQSQTPTVSIPRFVQLTSEGLVFDEELFYSLLPRYTKKAPPPQIIPCHSDTSWSKLIIRVLDHETVEIQIGTHKENRTFSEMGMVDGRVSPPRADSTWVLLSLLASQGGSLSWQDKGADPSNRKRISNLSKRLRELFPHMEGEPIPRYNKTYRVAFTLTDLRNPKQSQKIK